MIGVVSRNLDKPHRCGNCHAVDDRALRGRAGRLRLRLFPWWCLICQELNVGRFLAFLLGREKR